MATNQNHDFFTTLTKDFYTIAFKGEVLLTVCPLEQTEPRRQVLINCHLAQQQIDALRAGKCRITEAQAKYNQLKQQKQF